MASGRFARTARCPFKVALMNFSTTLGSVCSRLSRITTLPVSCTMSSFVKETRLRKPASSAEKFHGRVITVASVEPDTTETQRLNPPLRQVDPHFWAHHRVGVSVKYLVTIKHNFYPLRIWALCDWPLQTEALKSSSPTFCSSNFR